MEYTRRDMTNEDAKIIAEWNYPKPYDIYNSGNKEKAVAEMTQGAYAAVYADGKLCGFFCTGDSARIPIEPALPIYKSETAVDVGLGIRPDMTGRGLGRSFLSFVIGIIQRYHPNVVLRLTVADFNKRAIKLYESFGFEKSAQFTRPSDGTLFTVMILGK